MIHARIPPLLSSGAQKNKASIFSRPKLEGTCCLFFFFLKKKDVSQILGKLSALKFLKPCLHKSSSVLDVCYCDGLLGKAQLLSLQYRYLKLSNIQQFKPQQLLWFSI